MENLLVIQENEFFGYRSNALFKNATIVYSCKQTRHKWCPNMFYSPIS